MTASHEERVVQARARVGSVLKGKYRLDRVVGVGGMAAVYASTHLRNAHRVAVKILHPAMAADASVRGRFLREGYAANSVEHPGTVRILDDDTADDGSVFLVMELLEGETLDHRWERNGHRLGGREVARLLYQVLDVLAAAHDKGVIHRDIKPENLFLTQTGVVKLLDFGIARMIEGPVTRTRSGGIVGTPAFMAPEQVLEKAVDAQSDLYGVGATAFALLSKRYVHEAENAAEMMVIVGSRPARSLALVCPEIPRTLAAVFDRALRFEKSERWPSARAMQSALAAAYRESYGGTMPGAGSAEDDALRVPSASIDGHFEGPSSDRASSAVTVLTGATPVTTPVTRHHGPRLGGGVISSRHRRSSLVAIAAAAGMLVLGTIVAITAGGSPSAHSSGTRTTATPEAVAPFRSPDRSSDWSAPSVRMPGATEPPSVPVESLPMVVPSLAGSGSLSGAPPAPTPLPARVGPTRASACAPPFTLDPATGKKKWKLECL